MIFIGYQGIGKSTLCTKYPNEKFIDLESGNFWLKDESSGKQYRLDGWEKIYAHIAAELSKQGYIVFVSSHATVREAMLATGEPVAAIVPSPDIKSEWLKKLEDRHKQSLLDKDFKAWANARDRYEANTQEIIDDMPIGHVISITGLDYDLHGLIQYYMMTRDGLIM